MDSLGFICSCLINVFSCWRFLYFLTKHDKCLFGMCHSYCLLVMVYTFKWWPLFTFLFYFERKIFFLNMIVIWNFVKLPSNFDGCSASLSEIRKDGEKPQFILLVNSCSENCSPEACTRLYFVNEHASCILMTQTSQGQPHWC